MQFESKPENFALKEEIKQRNDRIKVEMFSMYQKTGVMPRCVAFAS